MPAPVVESDGDHMSAVEELVEALARPFTVSVQHEEEPIQAGMPKQSGMAISTDVMALSPNQLVPNAISE